MNTTTITIAMTCLLAFGNVWAALSVELNPYMGAPVTLVEAPNGAIANKRILDVADKVGWLKPTIEQPVEGVWVLGGYGLAPMSIKRPTAPRLVLQVTVDQLRGDLTQRYLTQMGVGGFRYLLQNGVVYENAHHAHANTDTIVGHTTLATGAHPSVHGLVGNVWFDRGAGRLTYNIEDARYPLLSVEADYVDPETWDKQAGIASLKKNFGIGKALIQSYSHPYVYLNHDVIRERGLALAAVEKAVAEEVLKFKGVSFAVSSTALMEGRVPDTWLTRAILNSHNLRRSGDIFIVFQPHWFINNFGGITVASTHGSPWRYDTYVPIIFAGAGLTPQRVYRQVYTVDVATTLAAFVGTKPPSGASGEILAEVLD